ncbi:NADH-quinone oxidoreductase subunit NuoE [Chthonobacter albigriseus]|uniref:NADH-quinone oxidoreductase subunit NuoE n=1 Tax=Chthonobacter albigriseus TaxID=1683161 RepID=UPI0015EFB146|nr:NADH-quinone oxidoreductase subunit NuoE [Chthonobacter albigriseus]
MSVRRLHHEQPAGFAFNAENEAWAQATIAKYPPGREASAVIPLLWRAQEQEGWVTKPAIETIADRLGMAYIRVLEVATFYTMFLLAPVGKKAHIQVCGTTPCQLRGAEELIHICKSRIAAHPFEISPDGNFSWEEVECLGACVNAPMVQVLKDTYEDLTPDTFNALIDGFAAGSPPKPGPQNGRQYAAAEGGDTTLTDASLYDGSVIGKYREYAREPVEAAAAPAPAPAPAPTPAPAAAAATSPATKPENATPAPEKATTPATQPAAAPKEDVKVSDEFKPALLAEARGGSSDDLKLIWGVGPKLEELLHRLGVFHFDQIASWNEMNLKWVDQNLGAFKGRAVRDKWIEQAVKLASGWRPSDKDGDKPT